jgi:hypothetical protein
MSRIWIDMEVIRDRHGREHREYAEPINLYWSNLATGVAIDMSIKTLLKLQIYYKLLKHTKNRQMYVLICGQEVAI